jgi:hypothetical protein
MINGHYVSNNNSPTAGQTSNPQAITTNGNYCAIPSSTLPAVAQPNVLTTVSYVVVAGAGVSAGTVGFQVMGADGTWRTVTTPNAAATPAAFQLTLAASTTFNGQLAVTPCIGVRLVVAALAGGNITYAELTGSIG